ncbi:hypothetical protein ACFLXU_07685, partial [Chloroflexota bacterium]
MSPYEDDPIGLWKKLRDYLEIRCKVQTDQSQSNLPLIIHFDISNSAPPASQDNPEVVFKDILLYISNSSKQRVGKFNNLETGQEISYDYHCSYLELP